MEEPKVFGRDHQLYRMAKNGSKAMSRNKTCTILFLSFFLLAMGRRNKENEPPIIILDSGSNNSKAKGKRAQWNKMTLGVLVDTLAQQKAAGNQTDNAAWKADAWTACEAALAGEVCIAVFSSKPARMTAAADIDATRLLARRICSRC
jgi:predicted ABC-type transport system involved in lysophospholipase L1 biosynthesis ATPase subunit